MKDGQKLKLGDDHVTPDDNDAGHGVASNDNAT
jgi:hypothetical protein